MPNRDEQGGNPLAAWGQADPVTKTVNEQHLATLKAKLMANRMTTSVVGSANATDITSRSKLSVHPETPSQVVGDHFTRQPVSTPVSRTFESIHVSHGGRVPNNASTPLAMSTLKSPSPNSAIEDLIAEGQKAATALKEVQQEEVNHALVHQDNGANNSADHVARIRLEPDFVLNLNERSTNTQGKPIEKHLTHTQANVAARPVEKQNSVSDVRNRPLKWTQPSSKLKDKDMSSRYQDHKSSAVASQHSAQSMADSATISTSQGTVALPSSLETSNERSVKRDNEYEQQSGGRFQDNDRSNKAVPNANLEATDAELWLQITGFHDEGYRIERLKTHKYRLRLEQKQKALEEEFAELERQEATPAPRTIKQLRSHSVLDMHPAFDEAFGSDKRPEQPSIAPQSGLTLPYSLPVVSKRPISPSSVSVHHQPSAKVSCMVKPEHPSHAYHNVSVSQSASPNVSSMSQR